MSIETIIEDIKQKARKTWGGEEGERRAERVEAVIRKGSAQLRPGRW